jgi:hypothetical protein
VSEEIEPIYRVAVQDGKLVLLRLKNDPDTLEPRTRDVFSGEVGTIRFTRDSNNHASGFQHGAYPQFPIHAPSKLKSKCCLAKNQLPA